MLFCSARRENRGVAKTEHTVTLIAVFLFTFLTECHVSGHNMASASEYMNIYRQFLPQFLHMRLPLIVCIVLLLSLLSLLSLTGVQGV